ncbi:putative cytochrome b561 [Aphelenchoides bicaudatus]|nr:putative cytochrome b561 [Aphelenchoides bicaudatus]
MSSQPNYAICTVIYIIAHLIGLALMTLLGFWINYDKSGFGFNDSPDLEFKFHPILMCLSLLFLNGEAIMIYRGLRYLPKWFTKFVHATLHTVCFTFMVLGLKAIWNSKDFAKPNPRPNAMSPHSWVGLATASLYGLQFVGGLITFYLPVSPLHVRQAVMPLHKLSGLIIFAFSVGVVLMGSGALLGDALDCIDPKVICEKNLIANLYALCVLGYVACVFAIAANPNWIRVPLDDEVQATVTITHFQQHTNQSNNDAVTTAWSTQETVTYEEEKTAL